jgi:hypothetical protein
MPIRFACPHCRQKLSVAQRKAGEQADCPRCHQPLTIPQPPEEKGSEPKGSGVFGGIESATMADVPPPKTPDATSTPPPVGHEPIFLPDAGEFQGLELVYETPATEPPVAVPQASADVVIVPRYVIYLQASLLAAVAFLAFVIGIPFGITLAPQQSSGPQACKITGSVTHRYGPRNLPDKDAIVIVLPQLPHGPGEKIPVSGLRPGDPSPETENKGLLILQEMGGGYARTDSSGRFELEVPRRGRYLLLVISRDQRSRSSGDDKAADVRKLRPYFDNPAQLLGDRRYRLSSESFRGDRELTITFE